MDKWRPIESLHVLLANGLAATRVSEYPCNWTKLWDVNQRMVIEFAVSVREKQEFAAWSIGRIAGCIVRIEYWQRQSNYLGGSQHGRSGGKKHHRSIVVERLQTQTVHRGKYARNSVSGHTAQRFAGGKAQAARSNDSIANDWSQTIARR